MKIITSQEKLKIIDLYFNEAYNITQISEKINISRAKVSEIINKYKEKNKIDVTCNKVMYIEKEGKNVQGFTYIPPKFLSDIGIFEKGEKIKICVDKNKKQIILTKK